MRVRECQRSIQTIQQARNENAHEVFGREEEGRGVRLGGGGAGRSQGGGGGGERGACRRTRGGCEVRKTRKLSKGRLKHVPSGLWVSERLEFWSCISSRSLPCYSQRLRMGSWLDRRALPPIGPQATAAADHDHDRDHEVVAVEKQD
eukprot:39553-Hanusia_phi.AAC.1